MYEDLKTLFGTDDIVPPGTIVISSDGPSMDEPNTAKRPIIIPDSPNLKVTSPIVLGRKPAHKKLFGESLNDDVPAAVSEESNSEHLRTSRARAKTKMQKILTRLNHKKCETSSYASSSPVKMVLSPPTTD